jgi:hypothetical protein
MRKSDLFIAVGIGLALCTGSASAHHSFAIYDAANPVELTGEVVSFRFSNPHSAVRLKVANSDGSETIWDLGFDPVNMLSRAGWKADTLRPGDSLTAVIHPMRNGDFAGRLLPDQITDGPDRLPATISGRFVSSLNPDAVSMTDEVARDFNGMWISAEKGIHFDTTAASAAAQSPPLTPEYQTKYDAKRAADAAGAVTNDPTALCAPGGFPRIMSLVYPGEIIQTDAQLNWYAEWNEETLRVYLDDRQPPEDWIHGYRGFSTGHWEGNTLVFRTTHLRGDTLIDQSGIPHSDQLEVISKFTKVTPDFFKAEYELHDPLALTEPWRSVRRYARAPAGSFIQEFNCFEGNQLRLNELGELTKGD